MAPINTAKPSPTTGIYLNKNSDSSTMGVGVRVDGAAFGSAAPAAQ
jgi:ribosomal protein L1